METKDSGKIFAIDENTREIYLFSHIDLNTIVQLTNFINRLNNESTNLGEIKIYINSLGGVMDGLFGLCETIIHSKIPVHTICMGQAYSAAFMVFISGHRRIVTSCSTLLHHLTSANFDRVDIFQAKEQLKVLERTQNMIDNFIANRTKISLEELLELRENGEDMVLSDSEAIEKGCADDTFINYDI